jgi:hypothetical protein
MTARVQLQKKGISGREPQGAWRQDKLIGGKPTVVKFEDSRRCYAAFTRAFDESADSIFRIEE